MNASTRVLVCLVSLVAAPDLAQAARLSPGSGAAPAEPETSEPPKKARKPKKRFSRGKKRCERRSKPDPELVEAEAIRGQILEEVGPIVAAGRHAEAAAMLADEAMTRADPLLYLAAAEVKLAEPRPDERRLTEAITLSTTARSLVLRPVAPRIAPDTAPGVLEHSESLAAFAAKRQDQLRLHRRGRAELVTGGVFLAIAVGGVGFMTSGGVLSRRVDAARADYAGSDAAYAEALDRTDDRADTLVAAGLIAGIAGAAIGIPLTATGSRDLKRVRQGASEQPRLRIAPSLAGLSLSGRF